MFLRSLRKDQHAVRTNGKRGAGGAAVVLARFGGHVGAPITFEGFAVTLPVAVETKLPGPRGREADDVTILRLVEEVSDDHDVVAPGRPCPNGGRRGACVRRSSDGPG